MGDHMLNDKHGPLGTADNQCHGLRTLMEVSSRSGEAPWPPKLNRERPGP